jgi:hypothetical protein
MVGRKRWNVFVSYNVHIAPGQGSSDQHSVASSRADDCSEGLGLRLVQYTVHIRIHSRFQLPTKGSEREHQGRERDERRQTPKTRISRLGYKFIPTHLYSKLTNFSCPITNPDRQVGRS